MIHGRAGLSVYPCGSVMNRRAWKALKIASSVCLPLTCVSVVGVLEPYNPVKQRMRTSFTVENGLSEPVFVTPVGASGKPQRRTLPMLRESEYYLRERNVADLGVDPGGTGTFWFDWDTVTLAEILVRTGDRTRMLVVDPTASRSGNHPPRTKHWVIDETTLVEPTPEVLAAAPPGTNFVFYVLLALGIAAPIVFFVSRRQLKAMERPADGRPT